MMSESEHEDAVISFQFPNGFSLHRNSKEAKQGK